VKRFPLGLTLAASLGFTILAGLGAWQLYFRLPWKENQLARIEALRGAPARPITDILARAVRGEDMEYARVAADCRPARTTPHAAWRYALRDGRVGWRLMTACPLAEGPFDGVILDRGLATAFSGAMAPGASAAPPPGSVLGVFRLPGGRPLLGPAETDPAGGLRVFRVFDAAALRTVAAENGLAHPAPYLLAVESERPAPAGLLPAALPRDIPNNHFVYAMTWFALAAILVWFYGAMLFRRLRD
jgi:surfeit locus 1 family protein